MGAGATMRNKINILFVVIFLMIMFFSVGCISKYTLIAEGKLNSFGIRYSDAYVNIDNVMYSGYTLSTDYHGQDLGPIELNTYCYIYRYRDGGNAPFADRLMLSKYKLPIVIRYERIIESDNISK